MDKKRIVKDFFAYGTGNYISQAFGVLSGFLLRIFLEPYYMGIWQGLNIIKSYTSYTNLGVTKAAAREIAYFRGKRDMDALNRVKNVCFTFTTIMITIGSAILILIAIIFRKSMSSYVFWGLIVMGGIISLERLESLIVTILRAYTRFEIEAVSKVFSSLLNVTLILLIVRSFKLYGLYVTHLLVFTVSIVVLLTLSKMRFIFSLDRKELYGLIKVGLSLVLLGFMFTNLTNVDRIVVIRMLGVERLGLYSVALMMGSLVFNVSNMASIVLYPRFQEVYGKNDSKEDVHYMMTKILRFLWFPLLCFIATSIIVLPYLVRLIMPKYTLGIPAMKIFLGGIYFLSLSIFCGHFLVTINKQKYSLYMCFFTVLLNLILNVTFVKMGWGIVGVALATSIAYCIHFAGMFITASLVRGGTVI